jgi:hypothetical protein
MTNTIEPMDLTDIYYVEEGGIEAKLTLKEDKKLYLGKETPIINYIYKVLSKEKIVGYKFCHTNDSIYLVFAPDITSREAVILLFKSKIIDDIKQKDWEFIFKEEWEKYQANFKSHIINKIFF